MEIKMRRAKIADAAAINAISNEMSGGGRLEIGQRPLEYHQEWLACHDRRHPVFVGTAEGRVVWWAALGECPGGYPFDCVAVVELGLPDHLNGTELTDLLLRFLEQQAARLGYYKLLACLDAEQRYLLHTYRRVGFRDVGTLRGHGYRRGKLVDLVLMERMLPADMEFLEKYYTQNYDFYQEYFEEERRRRAEAAQGNYALEYEEVEVPGEQLPEGIVRFLRTKKTPDGRPMRRPTRQEPRENPAPAGEEAPAAPSPPPSPEGPQLPEGIIRFLKSKKKPDGTPVDQDLPPVVPVRVPTPLGDIPREGEPGEEPAEPEPPPPPDGAPEAAPEPPAVEAADLPAELPEVPEEPEETQPPALPPELGTPVELDENGELEGQLQFDDILK